LSLGCANAAVKANTIVAAAADTADSGFSHNAKKNNTNLTQAQAAFLICIGHKIHVCLMTMKIRVIDHLNLESSAI